MGNSNVIEAPPVARPLQVIQHEGESITCASISEDGSLLITGGKDKNIYIWSLRCKDVENIGILRGHTSTVSCLVIHSTFVISGSEDKSVKLWDMTSTECLQTFEGHEKKIIKVITDGDLIYSCSNDRTVKCWKMDQCIEPEATVTFKGHTRAVFSMILIPGLAQKFGRLITGSADDTARIWNVEIGLCLKVLVGHSGPIACMTTDITGKTLFTGSMDGTIRSWSINSGCSQKEFRGHTDSITSLIYHEHYLLSGSSDKTVRRWLPEFPEPIKTYRGSESAVSLLKGFGPHFIFAGSGNTARCIDSESGQVMLVYSGHCGDISGMYYANEKLYTTSSDGYIAIWATTFKKKTQPREAHLHPDEII